MSSVLFVEPQQAPLIREAEPAVSPLAPGKALGVLLATTDRELRQACRALRHEADAHAGAIALMHPLRSFLMHLEQPSTCRELILGCLNHMVESAPPKKVGQQPRTVQLLLTAANVPCAWSAVCTVLDDTLGQDDKKLKLSACIILRELLVAHLSALENDPRHVRSGGVCESPDLQVQAQAVEKLKELVDPLLPLVDALQAVAERDGKVDSTNARCDPLPTRLTTLAADCCILIYTALGRITLQLERPVERLHSAGVVVVADNNTDDAISEDSDQDGKGLLSAGAGTCHCEERSLQDVVRLQLWHALPHMEKLLRLLRQWYSGRKATLLIGIDGFLARLAPLSKFFAFERQLRDSQKDAQLGRDGGGLLGLLWAMLGPPLMAEGDGLVQDLEKELSSAEQALPLNAMVMTAEERKHCELPCEMAVVAICLLLGRSKSRAVSAVMADGAPRLLPLLLQVLHTGWESAARVSASLAGVLLSHMSTEATLQQLVPSLMTMLDTVDTAAEAVVSLMAQALVQSTAQVEAALMEQILTAVDSTSPHRRDNGVKVLEHVVRHQRQVLRHGKGSEQDVLWGADGTRQDGGCKDNGLMDTLCRVLLTRLKDEELTMRCRTSELLAHGRPGLVLPPLCRLLYARDARMRAAAERAILAILVGHHDPLSAAETLLGAIRQPIAHLPHIDDPGCVRNPSPAPQHPGDIGSELGAQCASQQGQDEEGAAGDWPGRVLRLLPKWLDSLSEVRQRDLRLAVASLFVGRVFAAPHDTVLIKACATVSAFLAQERVAVLPLVLGRLSALAETEKVSLPGGGVESIDEESRQDLLFARLSPLLVLKVMPKEAFALEEGGAMAVGAGVEEEQGNEVADTCGEGQQTREDQAAKWHGDGERVGAGGSAGRMNQWVSAVFAQLAGRLFDSREFKPVREVAAEVMARMPPHMTAPLLRGCLAKMLQPSGREPDAECRDDGDGEAGGKRVDDAARTALLVLCHAPICHGLSPHFRECTQIVQRLLAQGPRSLSLTSPAATAAAEAGDSAARGGGRPGHLQEGCVAALSAAVVGHLTQEGSPAARTDEIDSSCPVLGPRGLLEFACRAMAQQDLSLLPADPPCAPAPEGRVASAPDAAVRQEGRGGDEGVLVEQPDALQVRACHLLANAARALPPTSHALRRFSKSVAPTCLRLSARASGESGAAEPPRAVGVREGCIQVLFIIVHGLGEQAGPLVPDVLDVADGALVVDYLAETDAEAAHAALTLQHARKCLSSVGICLAWAEEAGVRLGALKLMGAAATAAEELFVSDEARLARMQRRIVGMANVDADPEVRALAAKLAQLIFPPA